uniref:H/ACA ribonucleoprotein complex subunit n=1 Tax=Globodera pallida TaxID=36090 RepID=A0A183BNR0_GLOPA
MNGDEELMDYEEEEDQKELERVQKLDKEAERKELERLGIIASDHYIQPKHFSKRSRSEPPTPISDEKVPRHEMPIIERALAMSEQGYIQILVHNKTTAPIFLESGTKVASAEVIDSVFDPLTEIFPGELEMWENPKKLIGHIQSDSERNVRLLSVLGSKLGPVNEREKSKMGELWSEFSDVLALDESELTQTDLAMHKIDTGDSQPTKIPPRPIPFGARAQVTEI